MYVRTVGKKAGVCMYACMHICMYACMYSMYVCMFVCMYVCMPVCMYMYVCMLVCTCFFCSRVWCQDLDVRARLGAGLWWLRDWC